MAAAFLFIYGLKRMSSPVTARSGIVVAGVGMLVATLASFLYFFGVNEQAQAQLGTNMILAAAALGAGTAWAWWSGKRVAMTDMPQMIALYNGMGGGAAAAIAAVELLRMASAEPAATHGPVVTALAAAGAFIGAVSFSGSLVAFGKLQGLIKRSFRFKGQQFVNLVIVAATLALGASIVIAGHPTMQTVVLFFALALLLGI